MCPCSIFAVNQHSGSNQAADFDNNLSGVIERSNNGTLVMYGENGVPLTRIWCIYEIWQTQLQRRGQSSQLHISAINGHQNTTLLAQCRAINLDTSESTVAQDKDRILRSIATSKVSKLEVELSVHQAIVQFIQREIGHALKDIYSYKTVSGINVYSLSSKGMTTLKLLWDVVLEAHLCKARVQMQTQQASDNTSTSAHSLLSPDHRAKLAPQLYNAVCSECVQLLTSQASQQVDYYNRMLVSSSR